MDAPFIPSRACRPTLTSRSSAPGSSGWRWRGRCSHAPPGTARGGARQAGRGRLPPDRPQQRRRPRGHLLRARFAEGAAVRRGGRSACTTFCDEHGVAYERCGKVIVATSHDELPRLDELERRGRANGVPGPAAPRRRRAAGGRAALRGRRRAALAEHGHRRLPGRRARARARGAGPRRAPPARPRGHGRAAARGRRARSAGARAPCGTRRRSSAPARGPTGSPSRSARPPTRASSRSAAPT